MAFVPAWQLPGDAKSSLRAVPVAVNACQREDEGLDALSEALVLSPVLPPPVRLRKRADFLAVQRAEKRRGRYFLLEVKKQEIAPAPAGNEQPPARIGYTVSKKNGNAVKRNRIKRRLREAVRLHVGALLEAGTDYVIVARPELVNLPFSLLIEALKSRVEMRPRPISDNPKSSDNLKKSYNPKIAPKSDNC